MQQDAASNVLILGLNPAWQKVFFYKDLRLGRVNRARDLLQFASGKGINVAVTMANLGTKPNICQFLGGDEGGRIETELYSKGVRQINCWVKEITRTCNTFITDAGEISEFVEPGPQVSAAEVHMLKSQLDQQIDKMQHIVITGTYPRGVGVDLFDILEKRDATAKVYLDGIYNINFVLEKGVDVFKVNRREILDLTKRPDVDSAVKYLQDTFCIRTFIITNEKDPVLLYDGDQKTGFKVPALGRIVNPIGAGDAFMGGLVHYMSLGFGMEESLPKAIGISMAKCMVHKAGDLNPQEAIYFSEKIIRVAD